MSIIKSSNITIVIPTLISDLIIDQETGLFMKSKHLTCSLKNS